MTEKEIKQASFLKELSKLAATMDLMSAKVPKVVLPGGKTTPPAIQSVSPLPKSPWKIKDFPKAPTSTSSSSSSSNNLTSSLSSMISSSSPFKSSSTGGFSSSSSLRDLLRSATRGTSVF